MAKKKILFVDDEPNILSGLKRMLRHLRKEMDFCFASSGKDALDVLAREHVDVIVSDMRMPGMDGATLLKRVQNEFPNVMRIILSGQAEQSAILETVGVAHQFLAKPSSVQVLQDVLLRACSLQDIFINQSLKKFITSIGKLPSVPAIYAELQRKLKAPDCSLDEIARIVEKDFSMSAKVLQLVNSAFFGLFKNIESPARAVNLLGLDTIKALVLNVGVFTEFCQGASTIDDIQNLWKHSLGVACYAKHIAILENQDEECVNNAFIAGLLHDIGKLLFYTNGLVDYDRVFFVSSENDLTCHLAEQEVFDTNHAEIGAYLLGLWGLPGPVIEAVAFHHSIAKYPSQSFTPALAVHAADIIYQEICPQYIMPPPRIDADFLEKIGFTDQFDFWKGNCQIFGPTPPL